MVPQAIRMAKNAFNQYRTRDPEEIIEARKIRLKEYSDPESLLGFFTVMNRKQIIGINTLADMVQRKTGLIHELGHSLNDYRAASQGTRFEDTQFFSLSYAPCEANANLTGADLCIADEFILDRIYYEAYGRLVKYINEHIDHFRSERARMAFEQEQMQEFYDCHSDLPSFEELACELGIDAGLVKFKFKALGYKGYELPNIPETRGDFLRHWQRNPE